MPTCVVVVGSTSIYLQHPLWLDFCITVTPGSFVVVVTLAFFNVTTHHYISKRLLGPRVTNTSAFTNHPTRTHMGPLRLRLRLRLHLFPPWASPFLSSFAVGVNVGFVKRV
ncbi:hypothetical protein D9758_009240 [Tetrapyrgos nigripes]|uniref:Uncharacterized protein n=1 Tax=Tetrapyrgos nigripes TaxID=182062 RepID=A0A8H5D226_9AGAR|nr:hypothetical protein D9758_009240 [Tetrapyrgos nigripes]